MNQNTILFDSLVRFPLIRCALLFVDRLLKRPEKVESEFELHVSSVVSDLTDGRKRFVIGARNLVIKPINSELQKF